MIARTAIGIVTSGFVPGMSPVNPGAVTPTIAIAPAVERDGAIEHARIAAEAAQPERVADHRGRRVGRLIGFGAEAAADRHRHAEHAVECRR